ncbi:hypothetical protein [Actinomyces viscosus]|uniref:hypothetical protein n=1 Tax=Actinomyces viscosus TaxID=1656 RepID=UPI000F829ABB|nr:hypothetical protein [Actinomyces viscosus]
MTLLSGGSRVFIADYPDAEKVYHPVTSTFVPKLKVGENRHLPAVWPDTGQDVVVLDLPGGQNILGEAIAARLTDIPVTNA